MMNENVGKNYSTKNEAKMCQSTGFKSNKTLQKRLVTESINGELNTFLHLYYF